MRRIKEHYSEITEKLIAAGLRPTRQRILLGSLLFGEYCRHVSAEMLHRESKEADINVSLATIYNTLHQFTEAGLLREINVEDGKTYFDSNVDSHHHFYNEDTGELLDIPAHGVQVSGIPNCPQGTAVNSVDVVVRLRSA